MELNAVGFSLLPGPCSGVGWLRGRGFTPPDGRLVLRGFSLTLHLHLILLVFKCFQYNFILPAQFGSLEGASGCSCWRTVA